MTSCLSSFPHRYKNFAHDLPLMVSYVGIIGAKRDNSSTNKSIGMTLTFKLNVNLICEYCLSMLFVTRTLRTVFCSLR